MGISITHISLQTRSKKTMHVQVIDAVGKTDKSPVLLFLHGKGEASVKEDELALVLRNGSPGFQAIQERLVNVTVVSPQAPHDPNDGWNWRDYLSDIEEFQKPRFTGRQILAVGFSRGGLGVLQLNAARPGLISRWAIVDPQRAADEKEEKALLPRGPNASGWLRYGDGIPKNKAMSENLSNRLARGNFAFEDLGHGALAVKAFSGQKLGGLQNMYDYLGLSFD